MEPPGTHYTAIVRKALKEESVFCPLCKYRINVDVKFLKVSGNLVFARCVGLVEHTFWATKEEVKQ